MPKHSTSRRAVLIGAGGLTTACVLTAAPAATVALGAGNITPIQKLWQQYVALLPEVERVSREQDLARDRQIAATPRVPVVLGLSDVEIDYYGLSDYRRSYRRIGEGVAPDGFRWVCAEGWRRAMERPQTPTARFRPLRPLAKEMLPIAERYEAVEAVVAVSSGFAAASAAWDAAIDRKCDLRAEILSRPAETMADLVIQAEIAFPDDTEALVASIQALAKGGANV